MRKILGSVFVIVAVVGVGIFATGAYFTDTVGTTNQVFTTGTADLRFGQCGAVGADCTGVDALYETVDMTGTVQMTGPGKENSGCLVIENKGDYDLTLSARVSFTTNQDGFGTFFQLAADRANGGCAATGNLLPWTPATTVQSGSPFPFGSVLAPSERLYVILYNRWDSTGDQNYLQGKSLTLTLQVDGTTE